MQSSYKRTKDLLRECLAARLPPELRKRIEKHLATQPGGFSGRKADRAKIAKLRAKGFGTAEIAERLGCHVSSVNKAERARAASRWRETGYCHRRVICGPWLLAEPQG